MILAGAALLTYVGTTPANRAARAIYESCFEAIYDSVGTPDLGLQASTSEYTDDVIRRIRTKLDVWETLG
jgi:isocitrate/isopropylmalate dehydrogenase